MPAEKRLCPVCGKVVGAWHKSGIHPKCEDKNLDDAMKERMTVDPDAAWEATRKPISVFDPTEQARRDAILRGVNTSVRRVR